MMMINEYNYKKFLYIYQWRVVTSETSHAVGTPKASHKIRYIQDQLSS